MFIVVDRSVNYCLFFGGIATIEVIFVWFVYETSRSKHVSFFCSLQRSSFCCYIEHLLFCDGEVRYVLIVGAASPLSAGLH